MKKISVKEGVKSKLFRKPKALKDALEGLGDKRLAFVPTMGALHQGHLCLVKEAVKVAQVIVVSIFVNARQFAEGEDFETYPRNLELDCQRLDSLSLGESLLFVYAPSLEDVFSGSLDLNIPKEADVLCAKTRPHFFKGVCEVLYAFFSQIKPSDAFFGEKDFQQYMVVTALAEMYFPALKIHLVETKRELNGLAMSSRNSYLTPQEHTKAAFLFKGMQQLQAHIDQGEHDVKRLCDTLSLFYKKQGFKLDYVCILSEETLTDQVKISHKSRLFVALYLNSIRLIDSMKLSVV